MGVAEDGSFAGSFSGGCVEAAVVAEAQEAIAEGKSRESSFWGGVALSGHSSALRRGNRSIDRASVSWHHIGAIGSIQQPSASDHCSARK